MTNTTGAAELPEALRFTKKPVTIEAIQWTGKNLRQVITFTDGPPDTRSTHAGMAWEAYADLVARDGLKIYTLEGKMLANVGDWIIRGVKGEYYPCKPDIFEATYSPASKETDLQCQGDKDSRRLLSLEMAHKEWSEKTEWVQRTATTSELGKHRADVLRERIETLRAQVEALRAQPAGAMPSNVELRGLWYGAGGSFHGPNVETGTMPEEKLLPFLRELGNQQFNAGREFEANRLAAKAQPAGAATPAAAAPGVPAKQVIAWRVVHQSCLGHGDVKGDWVDGAPTEWQVNDFRQNAPGARIEYAYAAPQPPAAAQEPVAIVKWRIGGKVVHLVGDVEIGALLYTHPQPAVTAGTVDAAVRKVLAMFPFNVPIQTFTFNGGPNIAADNDTEFYSVKRVLAFLTEVKTTLEAAQRATHQGDQP